MGTYTLNDALARALARVPARNADIGADAGGARRRSGGLHRTGAAVLRDSVEAGTFEHVFFAAPARGETDRVLRAARRLLDAGRQLRREARAGLRVLTALETTLTGLTAAGVRVFEELLTLSRLNQGRVYPSYNHLSDATGLGRATVARALHSLEVLGLLVRQRRFKRIAAEGPGPRYGQTSNAYRAVLPERLAAYLPRWMRPAPLPADEAWRHDAAVEDMAQMRASLSCREFALSVADGPLAKVLAKLGAALDGGVPQTGAGTITGSGNLHTPERESQNDPQPLPESYDPGSQSSWPHGQRAVFRQDQGRSRSYE